MKSSANVWQLIEWVNALRPSNKPYPLVSVENVIANSNGRALVQIYTNRFHTRDTMGAMLELMRSNFGDPDDSTSTSKITVYEWTLGPTRSVQTVHRLGIGTFIQLIDKGVENES